MGWFTIPFPSPNIHVPNRWTGGALRHPSFRGIPLSEKVVATCSVAEAVNGAEQHPDVVGCRRDPMCCHRRERVVNQWGTTYGAG